jgi:predicted outer membrane repeat protein
MQNQAGFNGGAIGCSSGNITFSSGTYNITYNDASQSGGALYSTKEVTLTGPVYTFISNTATKFGGAIYGGDVSMNTGLGPISKIQKNNILAKVGSTKPSDSVGSAIYSLRTITLNGNIEISHNGLAGGNTLDYINSYALLGGQRIRIGKNKGVIKFYKNGNINFGQCHVASINSKIEIGDQVSWPNCLAGFAPLPSAVCGYHA